METISRQEFIDMVAAKSNNRYPKIDLYYIIRDAFWCLEDILRDGNRFEVKGILGIYPEYIEERQYNNFNKGKATVPPHYKPVIKPYSECPVMDALLFCNEQGTERCLLSLYAVA